MHIGEVHHYLLNQGLIDRNSLVEGTYSVTEQNTRNKIFKVRSTAQHAYFIKQRPASSGDSDFVLQKEATCLWLFNHAKEYKNLLQFTPAYFGYDVDNGILICEYIEGTQSLENIFEPADYEMKTDLLIKIAEILSAFHFPLTRDLLENRSVRFFPRQIPWVFNLLDWSRGKDAPPFGARQMESQVIAALQHHPEHLERMAELKPAYQLRSLIHGDVKYSNFLVCKEKDKSELRIVDWEIADVGDPIWDAGGVIHNLLLTEILRLEQQKKLADFITAEQLGVFGSAWRLIHHFFEQYIECTRSQLNYKSSDLSRALQFSAVRLVQSAFEFNSNLNHIRPAVRGMLQVSLLMLQHTEKVLRYPGKQASAQ